MSLTQLPFNDDISTLIKIRHSFYETISPKESRPSSKSDTFSRSLMNVVKTNHFFSIDDSGSVDRRGLTVKENSSGEYYKNYEYDEVPVKDSSSRSLSNSFVDNDIVYRDLEELADSDLDRLEVRLNMSKELQTDESSEDKYEYNIKIFKTTIQEILDKFYSNVHDIEIYKKKFHDILSKKNVLGEMEDFIKEIIQNIVSSESCLTSEINATQLQSDGINNEDAFGKESRTFSLDTGECIQKTEEAYKNENYLTDSTLNDDTAKIDHSENKTCNIYLLKGNPCVEIKMDDRNMLSEINIRNRQAKEINNIASADNVKCIAAKRLQMAKYMKQTECRSNDKIIPVKISYAKKNILSEDYPDELDENNKSFIYKICNYLCKKLRKASFG